MRRGGRLSSFQVVFGMALIALGGLAVLLHRISPKSTIPDAERASTTELFVYCAAGLRGPMEQIATDYERDHRVRVQLQFGGSNTLLSQIKVASVGDLFVSADNQYIAMAIQDRLVRETMEIAVMRPVMVVAKGNPKQIRDTKDLLRNDVKTALGNPEQAAIGKLVQKLLTESGEWPAVQKHVTETGVFKPTVHELANDVKLGSVDAAIVWDSTAVSYPGLEVVRTELLDRGTGTVTLGVLESSRVPTETLRFARYVAARNGGLNRFREQGFTVADGDLWVEQPAITFFCGAVNRRAVEATIKEFEQREGVVVHTVYNGCGILTAQMRGMQEKNNLNGFPDTYMACDRFYLDSVKDWFQDDVDVSDTEVVIAVPKGNPAGIRTLADLAREGVRVSVGQPEQCTIGVLTKKLLESEGIYDAVMKNVVMQTTSSSLLIPSVTTNSVDATLAYATDTLAEQDKVDAIRIESSAALAIQPFAIARSSEHKQLGRRLLVAIQRSQKAFEAAGFHFRMEPAEAPATDGSAQ